MEAIKDFFITENNIEKISPKLYKQADFFVHSFASLACMTYQSIYVIDFYRKNFLYVSDNSLFLCGCQPEEIKKMGYSFYFRHVPKNEVSMLMEFTRAGFDFFNRTGVEERMKLFFSLDFHIKGKYNDILVNEKIKPIVTTDEGKVWLAVCFISLSNKKEAGNFEAHIDGKTEHWAYSTESRKWKSVRNRKLSIREQEILHLFAQGYSEQEIATKLHVGIRAIKNCKQRMFEKLEVKTISAALLSVYHKKMI